MKELRTIKKGAEAELILAEWLGLPVIVKRRVPKPYRRLDFDLQLRKTRTLREASLMSAARRLGVPVPALLCVDVEGASIIMEYVKGPTLKELLINDGGSEEIMYKVGVSVGKLHRGGLVHGDLTTSNMIWSGRKVFLVDFGLGSYDSSIEARGVDLHLMLRALESLLPSRARDLFKHVLQGYSCVVGHLAKEVIRRAMEVRLRGRYVEARVA